MARTGGYGYAPGMSPPMGRRSEEAYVEPDEAPTEDWPSLVRAGYTSVFGVLVDGIPYGLGERRMLTVRGVEALPPTDDHTMSEALMVTPGMASSCEIEREAGVGSGRARDLVLRRQTLVDEGLTTALFKTPGVSAVLRTSVSDPAATIFEVDSTTSWPVSGRLYIGRECADYGTLGTEGPGGASFEGLRRGVAGMPHYHAASGISGYAIASDVPQEWVGRIVTWYEHLVAPDGRFLGTHWCRVGTYCREYWTGTIDSDPQDTAAGKVFRGLPIVRGANQEIGAALDLEVALDSAGNPLLWFTAADQIKVHVEAAGSSTHVGPTAPPNEFATLDTWCALAADAITTSLGGSATVQIAAPWRPQREIIVTGLYPSALTPLAHVVASGWFLVDGTYGAGSTAEAATFITRIPVDLDGAPVQWVVLRAKPSEEVDVADIPVSGTAMIESGNVKEIVRWDGTRTVDSDAQADLVALRIVERQVDGSPRANFFAYGGTATLISGTTGSWSQVFRELMTSSGTGARGEFDRLGFGFGCGFPETLIDLDALASEPMATQLVSAAASERRGIGDVIGGWLALWSRCLVQRRNRAGRIVLTPVSTLVTDNPAATVIGADDVLLGTHGTPEVLQSPNTIIAEVGGYDTEAPPVIYCDRSRAQAEGQRSWKLVTPGGTTDVILQHAPGLTIRTRGQRAVKFEAPPECDLQCGDPVVLETAHPTVYDVTTGTYAPASINAIVAQVARDDWTLVPTITLLLAGQSQANALFCPTARVTNIYSTTELMVVAGDELDFAVGDEVKVYEPGNEGAYSLNRTIDAIDTEQHMITVNTAVTLPATNLHITYREHSACTADQQALMFVRSDKRFR